jgi:hypothetical protein
MNRYRLLFFLITFAAFALSIPVVASASERPTGQDCVYETFFNGQGIQVLGHRCAKAYISYSSVDATRWKITSYRIYYDVSGGLSYGATNSETPAYIKSGYLSGMQSGDSADSGATNDWIYRTFWTTSYTYKAQTVFHIRAYPDIPGNPDPRLEIETSEW